MEILTKSGDFVKIWKYYQNHGLWNDNCEEWPKENLDAIDEIVKRKSNCIRALHYGHLILERHVRIPKH